MAELILPSWVLIPVGHIRAWEGQWRSGWHRIGDAEAPNSEEVALDCLVPEVVSSQECENLQRHSNLRGMAGLNV